MCILSLNWEKTLFAYSIYIFDTTHVTILVEHSMGGRLQKERDD